MAYQSHSDNDSLFHMCGRYNQLVEEGRHDLKMSASSSTSLELHGLSSLLPMPVFTTGLQCPQSYAVASRAVMPVTCMHACSGDTDGLLFAYQWRNSPFNMSFGMPPLANRWTWPSHRLRVVHNCQHFLNSTESTDS